VAHFINLTKDTQKREKKRREFKQNILNHLDELQSNNPKEIWSLVNQLCNEQSDKSVSNIDGDTWYKYFSILASVPNNFKSRLHKIKNKLKLLE
jgi:CRISPR/Cas system-associated endonuclease Cas1